MLALDVTNSYTIPILILKHCIDSKLAFLSRLPVAAGAEEDGRQGLAGGGSATGE